MRFHDVSLKDLSSIEYTVALSVHEDFTDPEFMTIRFSGKCRYGPAGIPDTKVMAGIIKGTYTAWACLSIILDFTCLSFDWCEEMNNVIDVGFDLGTECEFPMVVIVSDKCREGFKKILRNDYDTYCREDLESAIILAREKIREFDECIEDYRKTHDGG